MALLSKRNGRGEPLKCLLIRDGVMERVLDLLQSQPPLPISLDRDPPRGVRSHRLRFYSHSPVLGSSSLAASVRKCEVAWTKADRLGDIRYGSDGTAVWGTGHCRSSGLKDWLHAILLGTSARIGDWSNVSASGPTTPSTAGCWSTTPWYHTSLQRGRTLRRRKKKKKKNKTSDSFIGGFDKESLAKYRVGVCQTEEFADFRA